MRIGRDPLLTQGSTGNTSLKLGGTLWIKASGKWLADAQQDDIFLPVDLVAVRQCIQRNMEPTEYESVSTARLPASIETAMHAVLPHAVVIHVHSVNTIAWAIREDAPARLEELLHGMQWQWIPYVPSGLMLAREIEKVLFHAPDTNVLVLANHGLVVCGKDCGDAEDRLDALERRLAITPRRPPEPDWDLLARVADGSPWIMPADSALHALGADSISRTILSGGLLYPCQAIFSNSSTPELFRAVRSPEPANGCKNRFAGRPFLIVEAAGTLVSEAMTRAEHAMLSGLVEVVQRAAATAPIRYLTEVEIVRGLKAGAGRYRDLANTNHDASSRHI
jgi:ribulose-5-phosphate 4-epimerase/fuculose-1-phosphate aldolase